MQKKTIKAIFFLGLFIIFFLSLPFLFLFNKQIAYYSYKEVIYKTVINNIVGRERKPEMIVLLLLDYFHYYLFTPAEATPVDKDVYNDLIRDIAWCDQRSWAMNTFLGKLGIDNRMIMTRNPEGESNHTVSEAFIGKKWIFIDPAFNLIIKDHNGEFASYDDICRDPSLFYLCPDMLFLREIEPNKYKKVKDYFTRNIFYNKPPGPTIWGDPVKKKDFKRRIITKVLDFYMSLFGKNFSYIYQDIYLKYFLPNNKGNVVFFKARNYDLFNRYQQAIDIYKNFINNFPEDTASEDAFFFLGRLYNTTKNLESSIDALQTLLRKYPRTKWRRLARYYIGYNYELLNNHELANDYYWQAIDMYKQLDDENLMPEESKVIRRLYGLLNERKLAVGGLISPKVKENFKQP